MGCSNDSVTYCGFIAIVGRPNVGKSTLMNRLILQKISITSRKPQTTRHRILGIFTEDPYQWIYVDTPGMTLNNPKNLNRFMNQTAQSSFSDVDAIVFVVDSYHWTDADEWVLSKIKHSKAPCFLAINKLDNLKDKRVLLPILEQMQTRHDFQAMIPLAAKTGKHVDVLQDGLKSCLPASPYLYDSEQVTDRNLRFMCSELLREKIFRQCGDELPYATNVMIESYQEEENLVRIHAMIWVDKENHKRMIIGDKGQKLKEMATAARLDMAKTIGKPVFLQCWCKVKPGWSDNAKLLQQMGYGT
jgi:GTP-binding protein Era